MNVSRLAGAAVLLLSATALLAAASDADKAFVGKVSQGGAYEVAASKFAVLHANAPDVKDLAIAEVHDHELVGAELKRISAANGVPIAPALNAEFSERLARLKAAAGPGFDTAYIEDMKQIHDKDEKLFAQEANDGSDAYKTFAHQTDLIVKRHLGALHGTDH
jgi:putative membrane protein